MTEVQVTYADARTIDVDEVTRIETAYVEIANTSPTLLIVQLWDGNAHVARGFSADRKGWIAYAKQLMGTRYRLLTDVRRGVLTELNRTGRLFGDMAIPQWAIAAIMNVSQPCISQDLAALGFKNAKTGEKRATRKDRETPAGDAGSDGDAPGTITDATDNGESPELQMSAAFDQLMRLVERNPSVARTVLSDKLRDLVEVVNSNR